MGHLVFPWEKDLNFFVSLVITEILEFCWFSVYTEVVLLKTFHNTWCYASMANIEEVMKFYNLGDKTLKPDFGNDVMGHSFENFFLYSGRP